MHINCKCQTPAATRLSLCCPVLLGVPVHRMHPEHARIYSACLADQISCYSICKCKVSKSGDGFQAETIKQLSTNMAWLARQPLRS